MNHCAAEFSALGRKIVWARTLEEDEKRKKREKGENEKKNRITRRVRMCIRFQAEALNNFSDMFHYSITLTLVLQ
jgi:hypothetical protein